jgi:hypothetical protein
MAEEMKHGVDLRLSDHPHEHSEVRIHIDQRQYKSPDPTTGEALYVLAEIPAGYELFREVQGDREGERISRDASPIHLRVCPIR